MRHVCVVKVYHYYKFVNYVFLVLIDLDLVFLSSCIISISHSKASYYSHQCQAIIFSLYVNTPVIMFSIDIIILNMTCVNFGEA